MVGCDSAALAFCGRKSAGVDPSPNVRAIVWKDSLLDVCLSACACSSKGFKIGLCSLLIMELCVKPAQFCVIASGSKRVMELNLCIMRDGCFLNGFCCMVFLLYCIRRVLAAG